MRQGIDHWRRHAVLLGTAALALTAFPLAALGQGPELRPARFEPRWNQPAPTARIAAISERARQVTASVEITFEPRLAVYAQQVDFEAAGNAAGVMKRLAREYALQSSEVAAARGAARAQVALAWLMSKPGVTSPIIGATKPEHLADAVAAVELKLTAEEIAKLEEAYVPHPVAGFI